MKPIHYLNLLLVIGILLSGCISSESTITPTSMQTQPPLLTSTAPVSKPTSTPRPTQTATLTPPVTLEPAQAKNTIRTLLREPVDCPAPCFWGVVPGQTTLGEAKNIFTRLGLHLVEDRTFDYDFDNGLSISATLRIQKDWIVENLTIYITPEMQRSRIPREWLAYSPETLIKRYGMPAKVDFNVDRGEFPSYLMDIYFDAVDLIVEYVSYDLGAQLQVCPLTDQIRSVHIWMGRNPENPPPLELVTLEQATSMTREEFSKLLIGDPSKACFNLKEEMFP